ncbi:hypothetical protein UlMin_026680 [Ulmus minor]
MAETLLAPIIDKLLQLLIEEAKLFKGKEDQVNGLKDELEIIQSFLRDADGRSRRGDTSAAALKIWIKQVRELADRIEDVIDEHLHRAAKRRNRRGFVGFLRRTSHLVKDFGPSFDLASEIGKINESLLKIKHRAETYGLRQVFELGGNVKARNDAEGNEHDPRLDSLFIEEDELVGIDSTLEEFVTDLVEGASTRSTISVVGEGGIGKTTLAKRVYDDARVKGHFDCHAWVTVSQSYDIQKLLRIVIRQVCPTEESLVHEVDTIQDMIIRLRQYLKTKRYVVVFDDLWQIDFWKIIKHAFPSNGNGSRIIITTRNGGIASSCKETSCDIVKELKLWPRELAWELFCKKAFQFEFEGLCPQELEQLSRKIVAKCQGLPLVITTIAGLLSTKEKITSEWQRVLDSLNSEFEMNPQFTSISKIISLSYYDLPYHLKPCFLYFGVVPEDYSVHEETLYRMWIAEGFVENRDHSSLEQVAEEYLNELIHRNLVSFELRSKIDRWCYVHNLMREIILSKADELCFSRIFDGTKRFTGKSRRLTICNSTENVLETVQDYGIRSIFLFNIDGLTKPFLTTLFEKFIFLKLLDFENAPLDDLPKAVGNLFHLKYLSLRGTKVKMIPKSIGKLQNLETLDLGRTLVCELPVEINMLQNLRYLFANSYNLQIEYSLNSSGGVRICDGIGSLKNLEALMFVESHPGGVGLVKELEKLRQLRSLGITKLTADIGRALCASIEKMIHLQKLYLSSISEDEILDLHYISSPPLDLRHLFLKGRLERLPDWILKPNLRGLEMSFSRLGEDPLTHLKALPNLVYLNFYETYDGELLHFEKDGFPRLKELRLRKLDGLKAIKIDKGALPLLEKLVVGPSTSLEEVPLGINHLRNLQYLEIVDVPTELVLSVQPEFGADYWKVKHIPFVSFWFGQVGNLYNVYKLGDPKLLGLLQRY